MSLATIHNVKRAQKSQGSCGSCGTEVNAGDPYLWYTVGFRSGFKRVRCTKPECYPRPSDRESSKLASIYSAQENAESSIASLDNPDSLVDDIETILNELADEITAVAEEYREAAVNPNTGVTFNTDAEERADTLESGADELRSFSPDSEMPEVDEGEDETTIAEAKLDWIEEVKAEAIDAINSMEMP
jgi:hypothetical protein